MDTKVKFKAMNRSVAQNKVDRIYRVFIALCYKVNARFGQKKIFLKFKLYSLKI